MGLNKRLIDQAGAGGIDGTQYFDVQTYTGNAATRTFTTGFQTDLVWVNKNNNNGNLYDSQRVFYRIDPTSVLYQTVDGGGITAFNSDGFTMGGGGTVNQNTQDYVYWAWSGGGSAVSNTEGSITSTVSANQDAGFSIVKYTTQSSGTATVGHGLSSPPDMVIVKTTGVNDSWRTYHSSLGAGYQIFINLDLDARPTANQWNNTAPTSSVFSLGTDNAGSYATIAYCFHSVDGYQKVGGYTGDGTSNNSITGLGFQPRFLLLKRTDASSIGNWSIFDSANGVSVRNYVNIGNGWQTGTSFVSSFDSDGFTLGTAAEYNINSASYIYLAIA
jgi:hypothetical protein